MQLHHFSTSQQLNADFAKRLIEIVQDAIEARDHAYLAVSGGRTPQALFEYLSTTDLPWHKVTITLADDRWLSATEKDSNERLVKSVLLQNKAATASFISLVTEDAKAEDGEQSICQRFADIPTFDAVILGMGEDGHTASLFPCSAELAKGLTTEQAAVAVNPTTAPYQRMTLSQSRLLNSRNVFLHLVGSSKLNVLNQAMAAADPKQMPIRAFLQHPCVDVQVMFATE
ncbi:MAG: 6-phosphogluconolactonase [Alkalimonas sp.]|nr:6-phosphogluconolactonase [Alkalimonas sp.]